MSTRWMKAAALGALAVTMSAACADAQAGQGGVAARVAAAPDGEVWMRFASRPGVCGGEHGISTSRRSGNRVVVSGSDDMGPPAGVRGPGSWPRGGLGAG